MGEREPNWQPISALGMLAAHIETGLRHVAEHLENLTKARGRPHVLDAADIPATTAPGTPRTARALHGWLSVLGHQLDHDAGGDDDPVAGAWQLLTAEQDRLGRALDGAARITRRAAEQNA